MGMVSRLSGLQSLCAYGYDRLIGNWTITLSVNFGTASLVAGTVTMCMFWYTNLLTHSEN
jgi:hypothetical protein